MYVMYTCPVVHVSAGNTSPDSLLVGSGDMERQKLCLPWTIGSSTIYSPQKVRMQIVRIPGLKTSKLEFTVQTKGKMVPFTSTVDRIMVSKHDVWVPFFLSLSCKSLLKISCPLDVLSHLFTRGHHPFIFANLVYATGFTDFLKQPFQKKTTPCS